MKARPTILLVDDNPDALKTYSRALIRRVHFPASRNAQLPALTLDIICVESVAEALDKLRTDPIDIVVVDLRLPGLSSDDPMGGKEVISESINLDPLRPIIVITGYGTLQLARVTFAQGIFDFIEKSDTADNELVSAVQRAIDLQAEKLTRSGNPFTPMAGVQPRVFGGRTRELEFFEQRLHRVLSTGYGEHFVMLGQWGIGKSTLVKECKKICRSRGYVATVVPLEPALPGTQLSEIARSIIEGILRDCPFPLERFKRLTQFFQSFGINIFGTGLQFSRDVTKKDFLPQAFLHDFLVNLWQDLKDKTDAFIVLLDDLDNFQHVPEIIMTLRQTLSMETVQQCRILFGMTCSPGTWKKLISSDIHHPLARYFLSRIELAPLSETETRDTIVKCLADTGVSFSSDIIDKICTATRGHPFELQVLCSYLFDNQLLGHVGTDMWEKSLQAALRDVGVSIFDRWLDNLGTNEKTLLTLVADSGKLFTVSTMHELAMKVGIVTTSHDTTVMLDRLCADNILTRSGQSFYAVNDAMLVAYLKMVNPVEG